MKKMEREIRFSKYLREQIGNRLSKARNEEGLSQQAVLIGNRPLVSAIENGECLPRYTRGKNGEKIITEKNFMTWRDAQNICAILKMNEEEFIFGRNDIVDLELNEEESDVGENDNSEINLSDNVKWILKQVVVRNAKLYPDLKKKEVSSISEFEKVFDELMMFDGKLALLKKNFESKQVIGWFDLLKQNYQEDIVNLTKEAKRESNIEKKKELESRIWGIKEVKKLSKNHKKELLQEVEKLNHTYSERYETVFNEFWKWEEESLVDSFRSCIIDQRFDEKKGFYTKRRIEVKDKNNIELDKTVEAYQFSLLKLDKEIEDWLNREVKGIISDLKNEYSENSTLNIGYQVFSLLELRNNTIIGKMFEEAKIWRIYEDSEGESSLETEMFKFYEETAFNMIGLQEKHR